MLSSLCFLLLFSVCFFFLVILFALLVWFSMISDFFLFLYFMSQLWIFILYIPLSLCKMFHTYNGPSSDYLLSLFTCTRSFSSSLFMILLSQIVSFYVVLLLPNCSSYSYFSMPFFLSLNLIIVYSILK